MQDQVHLYVVLSLKYTVTLQLFGIYSYRNNLYFGSGLKISISPQTFFNDGVQNIKVLRGDAAPRYLSCSGLCHYCRKGVSLGEGGSSLAEESRGEIHPRTGPP